ncbi:hypothetical protein [Hyalangium gracile]|uniref:hypothetical protein n=1 Tax=Hyalangium gracile TaxID=394092 RepID=UPI001CCDED84|nr:hypothetical protein [Hyalangium gracile]
METVGALISTIGIIAGQASKQETRNNDQQAILEEIWREDDYFKDHPEQLGKVAGRVADGTNYDLGDIAESTGLSREEVFGLVYNAGPDPDHVLPQLIEIATSVGLRGRS